MPHFVARRRTVELVFVLWLALAIGSSIVQADIVQIGEIEPSNPGGVSIGIEGITFDGGANPLVLDRWSWAVSRVSLSDASVLTSQLSTPVPPFTYSDQLAYDPTSGDFYTISMHSNLVRIDGTTLHNTTVGSGIGAFFNFDGMAADPAGRLWIATDNNGGQLWSVDKQTGLGTIHTLIHLPVNHQLTALAIDRTGHFFLAVNNNNGPNPVEFRHLDVNTGLTTLVAQGPQGTIDAMAFDPLSDNLYGIQNDRWLVQITGVPEPGSLVLAGAALVGLLVVARRRKPA